MRNVSDGKEYTAKQYFCSFDWDEADKSQKLRNVGIYHRLSLQLLADFFSLQERIVEFIGTPDEDIPMLNMGYRPEGDLAKQRRLLRFSNDEIGVILYQCLEGLCFLHSKKVIHRDVKPENILFAARYPLTQVKLADFGIARVLFMLQALTVLGPTPHRRSSRTHTQMKWMYRA